MNELLSKGHPALCFTLPLKSAGMWKMINTRGLLMHGVKICGLFVSKLFICMSSKRNVFLYRNWRFAQKRRQREDEHLCNRGRGYNDGVSGGFITMCTFICDSRRTVTTPMWDESKNNPQWSKPLRLNSTFKWLLRNTAFSNQNAESVFIEITGCLREYSQSPTNKQVTGHLSIYKRSTVSASRAKRFDCDRLQGCVWRTATMCLSL